MSKTPRHATAGIDGIHLPKQSELEKWEQKEAMRRFWEKRKVDSGRKQTT